MLKECDVNTVVVFPSLSSLLDRKYNCGAFKDMSRFPYVWIIDGEDDGVEDEGFQLVPNDIKERIHNPERFTTWVRGNESQWLKIDISSPEKMFAEVFRLAFFERIDRLAIVLQEMGVGSIEVIASDKRDNGQTIDGGVTSGIAIKAAILKIVNPKADASIEAKWEHEVKQELEKKLNVRFSKKKPDDKRVQDLIRRYDFNGNMIVEAVRRGIESLESFVSVNFMETTYFKFQQTLNLALKVLGKFTLNINAKEKLEVSYKKHRNVCQKFNIKITTQERFSDGAQEERRIG